MTSPAQQINDFLAGFEASAQHATPGPYYYDCGNGEVEAQDGAHYRVSMCDRPDRLQRNEHYKYGHLEGTPKDTDDDMEYIAKALNAAPKLSAALRVAVKAMHDSEVWTRSQGPDWNAKHSAGECLRDAMKEIAEILQK